MANFDKPWVVVDSLGLCEHCGELLCLHNLPSDAIDAVWKCPKCGSVLTYKSFGYKTSQGNKIKWVGPKGKWVFSRPEREFELGRLQIVLSQPTY
jgi:hypothetical protein